MRTGVQRYTGVPVADPRYLITWGRHARRQSDGCVRLLCGLRPIVTALELIGAHFFLSGPIATTIHGVGRAPLDIELVSDLAPNGTDILDRLLAPAIARSGSATLLRVDLSTPITLRRARPGPLSAAAFARAQAIVLDEASGFATSVASAEDAVLDLLPAVAQNPRSGSQLWYDLMGVLKLQGAVLDLGYIERVAAQAGLSSTWRELLGQCDRVPLAWDCPLEAERRWLAHCRTLSPTERFRASRAWMGAMIQIADRSGTLSVPERAI